MFLCQSCDPKMRSEQLEPQNPSKSRRVDIQGQKKIPKIHQKPWNLRIQVHPEFPLNTHVIPMFGFPWCLHGLLGFSRKFCPWSIKCWMAPWLEASRVGFVGTKHDHPNGGWVFLPPQENLRIQRNIPQKTGLREMWVPGKNLGYVSSPSLPNTSWGFRV